MTVRKNLFVFTALAVITACSGLDKKPDNSANRSPNSAGRIPASAQIPDLGPEKLNLDPMYLQSKADYHFTLGEAYSLEGNTARAVEEYKLTLVYDPNSALVNLKLATEFIKLGRVSDALGSAQKAADMDPNSLEAYILLGGIYSTLQIYDKAEESYRHVMKVHPQDREAPLYLGALLAEQKKYDEAIAFFNEVAESDDFGSPHVAHFYIGQVNLERDEDKKALRAFKKSLKAKPDFTEGVLALSGLFQKIGERKKSIRILNEFQDKYGPKPEIAIPLSQFYMEDEEYDKAYRQFQIIVDADPEQLNARVKMALISIERKDYKKAIKELNDILVLAPKSDKIRFFLGAVFEEISDYDRAIEEFEKIPPESSYYNESIVHIVYLYKLKKDPSEAQKVVKEAIKLRPDMPQFYGLFASLMDDNEKYGEAVNLLTTAVERFPRNAQMRFFLGTVHDKVGNRYASISNMKKAIELDTEHVQALNYLAYTYAEMDIELDRALELAKKAVNLKPGDPYIQDTLGWVFYKKGMYEEAVKELEVAYKLKSTESIIAEHLGDAYYQYQLPQKAREMYRKAVELETDSLKIKGLRLKISSIETAPRVRSRVPANANRKKKKD